MSILDSTLLTLEQLQPYAEARIRESAVLMAAEPVILLDDGSYPQTPDRNTGLEEKGLVITVWQIDSSNLFNVSRSGVIDYGIYMGINVEANVKVLAERGIAFGALGAAEYVMATINGRPRGGGSIQSLLSDNPPFANFGVINGVHRVLCQFTYRKCTNPDA